MIATAGANAADVFWNNPLGGAWSNPANWNPSIVPGASDRVFITATGAYTVTLDVDATVAGFTFGGAGSSPTLLLNSRRLTLNGASIWNSGAIVGPGTIANSGSLNITRGAIQFLSFGAILNNTGTLTLSTIDFRAGTGATINNLSGATFVFEDGAFSSTASIGGVATLINAGRVVKADSTGTANWGLRFNNNSGSIEVQTGRLRFIGGGASTGGTFTVASGATLDFSGGPAHVFSGSYTGATAGAVTPNFQIDTSGVEFNFPAPGFNWFNGSIAGPGPGVLTNRGNLNIMRGAIQFLSAGAIINNAGTITLSSTDFRAGTGAIINNLAGGTFALEDGVFSSPSTIGGVATLVNAGRVVKADSTGAAIWGVRFNNTGGSIEVQTGTLRFIGGGASTGGTLNVSSGATLDFSGGAVHVFSGGYTGTTAGRVTLNLQMDSSGAEFNFPAPGFNWFNGSITGPGPSVLTNRGNLNIMRGAIQFFSAGAIITNAGTITLSSTDFRAGTGATINNLPGATFVFEDGAFSSTASVGGVATLNNAGRVVKAGSSGTATWGVGFTNTGTVETQSGILRFTGGFTQTAGATILNGGNLTSTTTLDIQGGSLSGAGTVTANVANAGQVHPAGAGSPGILNITGTYTQTASGALNIEIGGLAAGTGFDRLSISGAATLNGALNVSLLAPFLPAAGNNFQIVNFGSRNGSFDAINGLNIGAGLSFNSNFSSNNLTLVTAGSATPLISLSSLALNFGAVAIGGNADQTVTVTNNGIVNLTIASTTLAGANTGEFSIASGGGEATLTPSTSRQISIRFSPQSAGNKTASLVITSNAASSPDTVSLSGVGTPAALPALTISNRTIDFGMVATGAIANRTATVTNTGSADLAISGSSITGANAGDFSIVSGSGQHMLTPASSVAIIIRFSPQSVGNKTAALAISSNAATSPDTVSLSGVVVSPDTLCVELPAGIIAWWPFNDTSDTIMDIVGGNSGEFVNGAAYSEGIVGRAVQFDGINDFIEVPDSDLWAFDDNDFTIELWANFDAPGSGSVGQPGDIFIGNDEGLFTQNKWFFALGGGVLNFHINGPGITGNKFFPQVPFSPVVGQWYHLAVIRNGDTYTIFINGEPKGSATDTNVIPNPNAPLTIGQAEGLGFMNGRLDEITIYNRALTNDEVSKIFFGGSLGKCMVRILPPVITATPVEGQSVTLTITSPTGLQPTTNQLFFRNAGETTYQVTGLTQFGNNLQGTIPSNFVTIRGVEYYISLSDGNIVVTFPAVNPINNPAILQVQVAQFDYQLALAPQRYKMISVPLSLRHSQVDSVLVDDFGEYNAIPRQWRLFRWQGEDYAEHPDIDLAFTPGTAFWLITRDTTRFDIEKAQSVNSSQPFAITLQPGWNQITTPFAFSVAWDSVQGANGNVQNPVRWNGQDYEYNQTTLEPWEGYFVFNANPAAVRLSVPNRESRGAPPETIRKTSALTANEFLLQIKAHGLKSGWKDEQNFVGMLAGATNTPDRFDFLEAPPIGDYIRLSIIDEYAYAGNFHAISAAGSFWDLRLSTTGGKEHVRLIFSEQKKLPEGFQIWVLDTDRQSSLPIAQGQVELEIAPKGATTNLRLIVGTAEFANASNAGIPLIPYQFALRQNYPNPFNRSTERSRRSPETKIEYELAERAEVKLEIFNLLGQRVRLLINAAQSAGAYTANWDGKDQRGNLANSGVYFYRLTAGNPSTGSGQGFVAVRKLVLSR